MSVEAALVATARIVLELPIDVAQARTHGIPIDSAHLVLAATDEGKVPEIFAELFADFVARAKSVAVIVVGAFGSKDRLTELLGTEPSESLLGYPTYLIDDAGAWDRIIQIDAEWIALVPAEKEEIRELAARLQRSDSPWWKLSNKTDLGALASEIEVIDPICVYYPSDQTLELIGTRNRILLWFDFIVRRGHGQPGDSVE